MSGELNIASQVEDILDLSPRRRQRGLFTVVCPVYNRRRRLEQALDSLLSQTYQDWLCLILDDGSTDGTSHISQDYARKDPRVLYVRFTENRGGVVMNEIGMRVACELGEYWSRLGSDDWFEPHKLMVDYVTLGRNELPACFGPYRCKRENFLEGILYSLRIGGPGRLLSGRCAISWANAAILTEVLRKGRDRFGGFCVVGSRNMEDFHCNVRIASVSSIVWRGLKKDMKTVVIGAKTWAEAGDESEFLHDGTWRVASDGASNKRDQFALDDRITREAIQEDFSQHPPEMFPAVLPRVAWL
jgi:hypothetical protein